MGGFGSGGAAGTGRKPKAGHAARLHGSRRHTAQVQSGPLPSVEPPAGMSEGEAAVWSELAPHALAARTLTPATARRLWLLCKAITMEASMSAQLHAEGWTYERVTIDGAGQEHTEQKANPLCDKQRAMMQRVEAGLAAFRLAPVGKELAPASQPDDPFDEFEPRGVN